MFSSLDIEKKMRALYTIEDIVSAMKAYAGVTIRRTDDLVQNIRAYENNLLLAMADIITYYPEVSVKEQNKGKRILAAFGSSQGLCGSFNEKMVDVISRVVTGNDILFVIGKRLKLSLELKHITYGDDSDSVASINGIQSALKETVSKIMNIYRKDEYYNLTLVFTYIFEKKAEISVEQILPPDIRKVSVLSPTRIPPFTYLKPAIIFEKILEELLFISLYRGYMESLRSENWYRLRSMEGASEALKGSFRILLPCRCIPDRKKLRKKCLRYWEAGCFLRNSVTI
ncbi:MAG: ATPGencoding subunit gamma of ATP synthase [Candidatus Brocadia fulgida]|uniref:ATPGencoding subunit gamma of ATP synthase n=1 Tax=Candidatus Brocadia fulgida TaxID=380242 RepID=A0A0M2UUV3_9BACT|nr:MAG: ATPGencoding subunit gamma of ATP synthase [Candidatus Brocadia fulgida]